MKTILLSVLIGVVFSAPPAIEKDAVVLRNNLENIGVEGYKYGYETSNGIQAEEEGTIENVGTDNESLSVRGKYAFIGEDGTLYTINYVADENGFQPQGAHFPH